LLTLWEVLLLKNCPKAELFKQYKNGTVPAYLWAGAAGYSGYILENTIWVMYGACGGWYRRAYARLWLNRKLLESYNMKERRHE
jgi:hypothetical protein